MVPFGMPASQDLSRDSLNCSPQEEPESGLRRWALGMSPKRWSRSPCQHFEWSTRKQAGFIPDLETCQKPIHSQLVNT